MHVDFMIRRRAALHEAIPALNAAFVEQFIAIPGFWGEGKTAADAPDDYNGEGAALDLRKALPTTFESQRE